MKSNVKKTAAINPLFFLMILTAAIFSFAVVWSDEFFAAAAPNPMQKLPDLNGQAAVDYLKKQGGYSSLQEAVSAARRTDLADAQIQFTASDALPGDMFFGVSVSLSGDTAVVGCPNCRIGSNTAQGAVYVFTRAASGWIFQQKLTASDGAAEEQFGGAVDIEGSTLTVGASEADINSSPNQGAVYVFVRSETNWTQQQKLTASGGAANDNLGIKVSISGNTIAAGSSIANLIDPGAIYVFVRSGTVWSEQQKLVRSDGGSTEFFGFSVDIDGDTIIGGAARHNSFHGAAYIFTRSGTVWTEQQKITGGDLQMGSNFGTSVAVSGETAVVGASGDVNIFGAAYIFTRSGNLWTHRQKLTSENLNNGFGTVAAISGNNLLIGAVTDAVGPTPNQGAVYQFAGNGENWAQQRKLIASDGAAEDRFGFAIAIDGQTSIVGAPRNDVGANADQGSAYLFDCGRTAEQQLLAGDGVAFDLFGTSIAVSGATVVVGAPQEEDVNGTTQGAAYVFVRGGTGWIQQQKLKANPPLNSAEFGHSVDINGETIVVGAWTETNGTIDTQGAAYVFVRSGTTWTQQARLLASDGGFNDQFGNAVAIDGETIVVGSVFGDVGTTANQGAAYIFTRSGATWTEQAKINSTDGAANDNFGYSVDISGETVVVGAIRKSSFQGAAYIFTRSGTNWSQQQKLTANDSAAGDEFGCAVTISDDTAAIGAWKDDFDQIEDKGSVYVFTRSGSAWTLQMKIFQEPLSVFAQFGSAVSLDGENLVVGQNGGLNLAWVYVRNGTFWSVSDELTGTALSDFGEAVGISGETVTVGALARNIGSNSLQGEAFVYYGDCSSAPLGVAASPIARRRCSQPAPATLGTVSDAQEPAGNLIVTAQTVPAGIALTNLTNTNGTVTANVGAECSALPGAKTIILKVADAAGGISNFNVTVRIIEQKPADFDGDGKSDLSIWRPPDRNWWILQSSDNNASVTTFGLSLDRITPGDFDGDGKTDIAVFRPATGIWYWLGSSNGNFSAVKWGLNGDIPVAADFDGDLKSDLAVFRPSNGVWYILKSSDGGFIFFNFGLAEDKPVPGDFDGDGRADFAVFRPSSGVWYIQQSSAGFTAAQFGLATDKPVQADYDGDSKTDFAVYRPAEGVWYLLQSSAGISIQQWGLNGDIPVAGDYDGDSKTDLGVFRPSQGVWFVRKSGGGNLIAQFGTNGDIPVESAYFPQ